MASNPVVNSLTFSGSVAGQASIQSQGIAGGLTFLLPNIPPIQGQLLAASAITGNNVFLGWSSANTNIPLAGLAQSGATNGEFIAWNGTQWAPSSFVPGSGTVTSVTFTGDGTVLSSTPSSAVTTTGTLTASLATAAANTVLAGPASAGPAAAPTYRKIAIADINSTQGTGSAVMVFNGSAPTTGRVATFDATGSISDGGTLLSALALAANLPSTATPVSHQFLTGYDAGTKAFSGAQPAAADLSDTATLGNVLRGNGTSFVSAQLASTDLSDTSSLAYLSGAAFTGDVSSGGIVSGLTVTATDRLNSPSGDVAGVVTITNPATTQAVTYTYSHTGVNAPVVVVTAVGADPTGLGAVWVTNDGSTGAWTGFTIHVGTTPGTTATFNYHVIGS